ncbi:hypothetical protein ALQ93_200101 [Pseudomonas syringae pv. pisi]|uniref:Peptidase S24/S26A/S26B/S26C domain-containing protein n=1 Tax=Pseudomonas savastanoi pv. phaseolicola TaxID=319 RepID=A0A7Z6Y6V4_PSESH|nr:S24 family peptidase [Pseudomonas syringae]RML51119.1 hypothetical protein ALQ93_200101 [Pseudomonas syringae pv. pisi]RML58753.1 hypothetical protein ALQ92_200155 [Pseudomonas syringae pv. pisi]RMU85230.1 hypothetical protein ALP21_200293 [Pseudomonas savastanoi pv. phaseolicola]
MNVKILGRLCSSGKVIPLYIFKIPAGFPNPAADHIEQDFSFDRLMDLRAPHIYVAKIDGDSMEGAKIFHDSLVVVDRSCIGISKCLCIKLTLVNGYRFLKAAMAQQSKNSGLLQTMPRHQ